MIKLGFKVPLFAYQCEYESVGINGEGADLQCKGSTIVVAESEKDAIIQLDCLCDYSDSGAPGLRRSAKLLGEVGRISPRR